MAAVLFASNLLFPTPKPSPAEIAKLRTDSIARVTAADSAAKALTATGVTAVAAGATTPSVGKAPDSPAAIAAAQAAAIDTAVVVTQRATFRTTNRGAALIGAQMSDYKALEKQVAREGGSGRTRARRRSTDWISFCESQRRHDSRRSGDVFVPRRAKPTATRPCATMRRWVNIPCPSNTAFARTVIG